MLHEEDIMRIGGFIDVPEDQKAVKIQSLAVLEAQTAFHHASAMLHARTKNLWATLHELYPETRGWDVTYLHGKRQIVLLVPKMTDDGE